VVLWQATQASWKTAAAQARQEQERLREVEEGERDARQLLTETCLPVNERVRWQRPPEGEERGRLEKALAFFKGRAESPQNDAAATQDVGTAYMLVGCFEFILARYPAAQKAYRRAIDLLGDPASAPLPPERRQALADCYNGLGMLLATTDRPDEAEAAYREGIALRAALVRECPGVAAYRRHLALTHNSLGALLTQSRRFREAEDAYDQALGLLAEPAGDLPDTPGARFALAHTFINRAALLTQTGRPGQAAEDHRHARDILVRLTHAAPKAPEYRCLLGTALMALALDARGRKDLAGACRLLEEAIGHQRAGLELRPGHPRYRQDLRDSYLALAATQLGRGGHVGAARAAAELPRLFPEDWREHYRAVIFFARCVHLAENDPGLSRGERRRHADGYALRLREHLQALADFGAADPAAANDAAWFLATGAGPPFHDAARAVELAKKAVERAPGNGGYWNTLGVAQYRRGDWNAAVHALERSAELREGGDSSDWFFLAMAYWRLDDKPRAQQRYRDAVRWMERHKPDDDELRRFRAEAAELIDSPNTVMRGGGAGPPGT
jgi:tetratricopeptide (TPR) repeat protein